MRLGVLEFGSVHPALPPALDSLRSEDIDVVVGESVVESLEDTLREARRLFRADCDGVLMVTGEGFLTETVYVSAAALLLAGIPLLLTAFAPSPMFFDAVGALESIGARFDRVYFVGDNLNPAASVDSWLKENAKKERHRGLEAARKLYGQRLYIPSEKGSLLDAALWMPQFGVIPTTESEGADFSALTGDACGALTDHLLTLVTGVPANRPVPLLAALPGHSDTETEAIDGTFARITPIKGRFRCLLLRGSSQGEYIARARFGCSQTELFAAASFPILHFAAGDHLGAMRTACESLGIDTVVLRPAAN